MSFLSTSLASALASCIATSISSTVVFCKAWLYSLSMWSPSLSRWKRMSKAYLPIFCLFRSSSICCGVPLLETCNAPKNLRLGAFLHSPNQSLVSTPTLIYFSSKDNFWALVYKFMPNKNNKTILIHIFNRNNYWNYSIKEKIYWKIILSGWNSHSFFSYKEKR